MRPLRRCPTTGTYTMKDVCEHGDKTIQAAPAKFSPEDKYGSYRRKAKEEQYKEKGWL